MDNVIQLFPSIDPYKILNVNVSSNHCLYVEQSGNPKGIPVIFLHGGPGAGTSAIYRRFFNPNIYPIIRIHNVIYNALDNFVIVGRNQRGPYP